jgi:Rps23 Pro-64 3,4-dihydroxylase Tpa1-like proline 4-hydroxylase
LKIKKTILDRVESEFFNTYELQQRYRAHPCYSLIEIKNFLPIDVTRKLARELDEIPLEDCKNFTRRGSNMYEHNRLQDTPVADEVVHALHSSQFINWLQKVTDTVDIIPDPHLIGAGYSKAYKGDSLKVHTDFNWNDELRLHRRLNCIIYLNENWKDKYGGHLEFWDTQNENMLSTIKPDAGNLLIWSYHNLAYHGYPDPMMCPENEPRRNLRLFYYVSNAKPDDKHPPHRSLYWFDKNTKTPYDASWKEK